MEVVKSVTLNLLNPTRVKQKRLKELEQVYKAALSFVVSQGVRAKRTKLQGIFYKDVKEFGLHSQVANDLFKDAVAILNNGGEVKKITVPYNIHRSGKFATTENGNPVISIATLNGRVALPIAVDGAYQRYTELLMQGYTTTHFRLYLCRIHVTLRKDYEIQEDYDAVIGVDIGVKTLAAVSVINRYGRVLRQLYFGRDVWDKQRNICLRRSKLKSYADKGERYAKQAVKRLRRYENNYTATRCWQVAHEIVRLAERYNAFIAIEDLKHLNKARGNKKGNRKSKRMPYRKLRVALESVAGHNNRRLVAVSPRGTSHICSRCGNKGNRNKAVFKCPGCGYRGNADRNASVNVAIRAGTSHPMINGFIIAQISDGNHAVNHGALVHDEIGVRCLQHHASILRDTPTASAGGS